MFQDAPDLLDPKWDRMWVYPGYRTIHIDDGDVVNFYYLLANDQGGTPLQYSWPFYQGTNVGGTTDFANLTQPAVRSAWTPAPGTAENVTCTVTNTLSGYEVTPGGEWSGDLRGAGMEFPMPYLNGGYYYTVTGGSFTDIYDYGNPPDHRVFLVTTDVGHAPNDSTPTVHAVSVNKSATPDTQAPTCANFLIDGGAPSTGVADVALTNDAVDLGGSGLYEMMVSNDDPSFTGCAWQSYEDTTDWTLARQAGLRTVYIRFRDAAMPANVSTTYSASIALVGNPPSITSLDPPEAYAGDTVTVNGSDYGTPRTFHDNVLVNGTAAEVTSWTDTAVTCVIPANACSGTLTVVTDAGSASVPLKVLPRIDSITPDFGFNDGVVQITGLAGSGFYAEGGYPLVRLDNGTAQIPATDMQVVSPHGITCRFDLGGRPTGFYDVVVENADGGTDTLYGGFVVDFRPPSVTAITPSSGLNGGVVNGIEITGEHFRDGATVELRREGVEIDATGVTVVSPEKLTCSFDLTGAAPGAWDVWVINPDTEGASLRGRLHRVQPHLLLRRGHLPPRLRAVPLHTEPRGRRRPR